MLTLVEQSPRGGLALLTDSPHFLNSDPEHSKRIMESLEVICICVEFNEVAVGKGEHGVDDAEDSASNSIVDQTEVGNIGSAGEVEFEDRRVDEGDLRGSDLGNTM